MTKQELYDGLVEQGLDQDSVKAVKELTASMDDELSQENIKEVLDLVQEISIADKIIARSLEREIVASEKAADRIMDAAEGYVKDAAAQTIGDIKLAKSILSQE